MTIEEFLGLSVVEDQGNLQFRVFFLQFYFPNGPPPSKDTTESCMARINQIFAAHPEGLPPSGQSRCTVSL